jgi:DHA2 family multidrug resistance protein
VDSVGFVLVALGLGCLEVFMDRGQRDDWFGSNFILAMGVIAVLSLSLLVVWELARKDPIVNIRLFANRNFAVCVMMMLTVGLIIYGSTQLIPQLLQQVFGYTATDAGLSLTTGGMVSLLAMPMVGLLVGRVQTRILLGGAFLIQAIALWHFSTFTDQVSFSHFAFGRMIQAVGLPFLFVPINAQGYAGLDPHQFAQASALLNVARNLGGSIGISATQALLEQREQFHQSRLVEGLSPLNPNYTEGMARIGQALAGGPPGGDPAQSQLGQLYQSVMQQAAMFSYLDVFHALMIFVLCIAPLAILLRPNTGEGGAH